MPVQIRQSEAVLQNQLTGLWEDEPRETGENVTAGKGDKKKKQEKETAHFYRTAKEKMLCGNEFQYVLLLNTACRRKTQTDLEGCGHTHDVELLLTHSLSWNKQHGSLARRFNLQQ